MIASKLSGVLFYLAGFAGYIQVAHAGSALLNIQEVLQFRPQANQPSTSNIELERWIEDQNERSFGYLLDNIGPDGVNAKNTAPGTVIASPSTHEPNYYFQWIRDAAITMESVINEFQKTGNSKLGDIIDYYADLQGALQHTWNPSGGYTTGGLGEPKFGADGAPFNENWGRPQRDGPALRALTLMKYIRVLNGTDPSALSTERLREFYDGESPTNSTVKADLEYVSQFWNSTGFDLWEEVIDMHFFTAMVQHKALQEGSQLARALGDHGAADWYDLQQKTLKAYLHEAFWNKDAGHLMSMLETPDRCGLDCALLLASIHGGQDSVFPPWSSEVLASLEKLVSGMKSLYPINNIAPPYFPEDERLRGVGVGRYPEDIYDGVGTSEGHPWFLCTSSTSSILYRAIHHFTTAGEFTIDDINHAFFSKLHPTGNAVKGVYKRDNHEFGRYLRDMFTYADSFLNVIRWHATADGRLSEQFSRHDGFQRGAKDLTWSYGSFVGAVEDRRAAKRGLEA